MNEVLVGINKLTSIKHLTYVVLHQAMLICPAKDLYRSCRKEVLVASLVHRFIFKVLNAEFPHLFK